MTKVISKFKVYKNREEYAIEMLDKYKNESPGGICSDIGCGYGWMKKHIIAAGKKWQPFDYVKKIDETILWDLNNECPSSQGEANICIMLEVLEHLPNPMLAIQNISNHLERGAVMIISVPNPSWSRNRLHLLLKGTLFSFQRKHLIENHVFTPWRHIVEFLFQQSGFEVLEYHVIQGIKTKPRNIKEFLLTCLWSIIEKRDPSSRGLSYGLVLRKK
jgi:hypothetical protein